MRSLLLIFLIVSAATIQYCQTTTDQTSYFITGNEKRVFPLGSYVKGFDLQFTVDDKSSAQLFNPTNLIESQDLQLQGFAQIRNIDIQKSPKMDGMGYAVVLALKQNNKQIGIWQGFFQGDRKLPNLKNFKTMVLPEGLQADCHDARVIDDQGKWFSLNCQTIPQSQDEIRQDLLCAVHQDHKQLSLNLNCKLYDSLLKSQSRSSKIMQIEGLTYLLSSNLDLTASKQAISYINIYYLNSNNQFVFNNVIDGSSLTPSDMTISDFIITTDKTIVVADSKNSRLVFYSFDLPNQVGVLTVINYPGRPLVLFYDHNTVSLFVGTKDAINEHLYSNPEKIFNTYEVDPTDSLLTNIQVSNKFVAFTTQNNNYYIYERGQTKINYVLSMLQNVKQIPFLLSEKNSYVYKFTTTKAETTYLSQPYIVVSNVQEDKIVNVMASSQGKVCNLKINLRYNQNDDAIIYKQDISTKSFKIDPINGLNLALDDYYAGADLSYQVKSNNQQDFTFEINHLSQYTIIPSFQATEVSTILQINSVHFYYIGINSISEYKAYIDFCTLQDGKVDCQKHGIVNTSSQKKSIEVIKTGRRSSGKSFVVWSYKYAGIAEWIYIDTMQIGYTDYGYPLSYTSLQISDSYFLVLSKTGRVVSILFQRSPFYVSISESFFNSDQLKQVEYFYPRQIYVDHTDQTIIYVKLPTKVVKFQILPNHAVVYSGVVLDLGEYQLDQNWSLNFDSQKVLLYRDNKISEWFFDPITLKYTLSHQLAYPTGSQPINFDTKSNLLYTVSSNQNGESSVKIMKPYQGSLEFQYATIKVLGKPTLSGNWLLISQAQPTVYFIDSHPTLRATAVIPEDKFKEDVTLTLVVSNKDNVKQSVTEFQGVNYPISIKNTPNNTIIVLPSQTKILQVEIPMDKYFTGPVGYYSLSCPMCGGSRIHLYGPLASGKSMDKIPAILDFVAVGTQFVALASNKLFLMSGTEEILFSLDIDIATGSCTNLQYNPVIGLLVFCKVETGQVIQKFKIENKKISLVDAYIFHGDNRINYLDEMFAVNKGDNNYLFVLDNDETVDSNSKKSIVKMLDLSANLDLLGTWNSETFGASASLPINDLEIKGDIVFVAIGNYGIGYGMLGKNGELVNPSNIQLSKIAQIKDGFLDDTFFKQVQILTSESSQKELNVFISTTNARHIVITLTKADIGYIYKALKQSYNRYGTQRLLNWHAVTSDSIYLSYYNSEFETVNLVHYKRSSNSIANFDQGVLIRLAKSMTKYHEAIIFNGKLIVSHLGSSQEEGQLAVYNIRKNFVIWFSYGEAGDFKSIDIQAFNDYKSSVHSQPVMFKKPEPVPVDPDGIKWYIVVIICASVLIAVGAAYGMFIYMKKKRSEKNISLLTEKEEGAEQTDGNNEGLQDTTTKEGLNRSSINAYD